MRRYGSLSLGSVLAVLLVSAGGAEAATGSKTPRECNSELYARLAAIKAAGETPAQFVHDCWYHSQAGQPTALAHPAPTSSEPPREAADRPAETPAALPHRQAVLRPRIAVAHRAIRWRHIAEARLDEKRRRRLARIVRAARVRLALEAAASHRPSEPSVHKARQLAAVRALRREARRRQAEARVASAAKPARRLAESNSWTTPDRLDAVAALGPSARQGQRMWVRVVAAGEVHIKPAVAVGALSDRQASSDALNCWGQPVMLVGRAGQRWSREMVCDGKPAGSNEWSAQIYYGGPATR